MQSLEHCKTKREGLDKELQLGCRYSELLELPYFNPFRHLLIDPMHNLFLELLNMLLRKYELGQLLQKQQWTPFINGFSKSMFVCISVDSHLELIQVLTSLQNSG